MCIQSAGRITLPRTFLLAAGPAVLTGMAADSQCERSDDAAIHVTIATEDACGPQKFRGVVRRGSAIGSLSSDGRVVPSRPDPAGSCSVARENDSLLSRIEELFGRAGFEAATSGIPIRWAVVVRKNSRDRSHQRLSANSV